ncbi:MAG: hypothetical protein IKD07_06365 [Clostridia bacterium]|nr:hypothetical protein [Clostridia bacterium]
MATSEAELHRALRDAPAIRTGGQAAGLSTSFSFFFFLVKKKDTCKHEFIFPSFHQAHVKYPISDAKPPARSIRNARAVFYGLLLI